MLGFLRMFGRSDEIQRLDHAFAAAGLPRAAVPDSVKLTLVRLLREAHGRKPDDAAAAEAVELAAYCMLGRDGFLDANGPARTEAAEARVRAAAEAGDSLDARVVLLTLHAGVIQPAVVERHGLSAG
jgi:hypothetical protein